MAHGPLGQRRFNVRLASGEQKFIFALDRAAAKTKAKERFGKLAKVLA